MHTLEIIMFIALCTYLSGGEGFYDMEAYAQAKADWLRKKVGMRSIPSHDTFNRLFQAISPECFGECLIESAPPPEAMVLIIANFIYKWNKLLLR